MDFMVKSVGSNELMINTISLWESAGDLERYDLR